MTELSPAAAGPAEQHHRDPDRRLQDLQPLPAADLDRVPVDRRLADGAQGARVDRGGRERDHDLLRRQPTGRERVRARVHPQSLRVGPAVVHHAAHRTRRSAPAVRAERHLAHRPEVDLRGQGHPALPEGSHEVGGRPRPRELRHLEEVFN